MSNANQFQTFTGSDLIPVSPNDGVDLAKPARALRIGVGGTLRFTTFSGEVRNTSVSDGEVFLIAVTRVHATGTTATDIEAII